MFRFNEMLVNKNWEFLFRSKFFEQFVCGSYIVGYIFVEMVKVVGIFVINVSIEEICFRVNLNLELYGVLLSRKFNQIGINVSQNLFVF